MKFHSLFYSLKVWLSSVLLAPLICILVQWWFDPNSIGVEAFSWLYPIVVFSELILSLLTWFLFWGIIEISGIFLMNRLIQRWLIFISSVILSASTLLLLCWPITRHSFNDIFFDVGLCNCICIGAGCWVFRLGPRQPNSKVQPDLSGPL
jgi:hypothetical protein